MGLTPKPCRDGQAGADGRVQRGCGGPGLGLRHLCRARGARAQPACAGGGAPRTLYACSSACTCERLLNLCFEVLVMRLVSA